jgi:hypothetical protein
MCQEGEVRKLKEFDLCVLKKSQYKPIFTPTAAFVRRVVQHRINIGPETAVMTGQRTYGT